MHRTGHDGNSGAAQRRDPRREENDGQIERKEAAHHRCGVTSKTIGAAILFGTSDSLLVPENAHKSSFRTEGGDCFKTVVTNRRVMRRIPRRTVSPSQLAQLFMS